MPNFELRFSSVMGIRTSKALKVFAILLFSFEMIAPAVISSVCNPTDSQSKEARFYSNDDHFTNLISSLLFEENSGEEEQIAFDVIEAPSFVFPKKLKQTSWIQVHEVTSSRPPLFTLFHTYII